ncbi:MAG TPA: hypothetical protein VF596_11195 [Pyrinomonadaceae bacterium]|jgi:hypothetical protein
MLLPEDILSKLIYLDSDFISVVYQTVTGDSPQTYFSKTQGKKGDSKELFIAHSQNLESKSFNKSSIEMLKEIYAELAKYPNFNPAIFKNYEGTKTVWINGQFTMGEWISTKQIDGKTTKSDPCIMYEIEDNSDKYALLPQPHLFSSNIGSLINTTSAIRNNIGIPTKTFGRILYKVEDSNMFVMTPYLILED